mmetsp:Transcript_28213/g.36660  ORF Transcript_28213/g.36660 Transcript_28213/m.36660 type:complete len:150 (+) Transcript_28213:137-586(+)
MEGMAYYNFEASGDVNHQQNGMYHNFFPDGPLMDHRFPHNVENLDLMHYDEFHTNFGFEPSLQQHEENLYNPQSNNYFGQGSLINGTVYYSNPDLEDYSSDDSFDSNQKDVIDRALKDGKAVTLPTGQKVVILPDAVNADKLLSSQSLL